MDEIALALFYLLPKVKIIDALKMLLIWEV